MHLEEIKMLYGACHQNNVSGCYDCYGEALKALLNKTVVIDPGHGGID